MAEQFSGKVEFKKSNSGEVIFTLDPDSSFVQLVLKTPSGFQVMELTNTGSLSLYGAGNDSGARIDGCIGWLVLRDQNNNNAIELDGKNHFLVLRNHDGKEIIRLNAEIGGRNISVYDPTTGKRLLTYDNEAVGNTRAGLFLGAAGQDGKKPGFIALRNDAGNDSIILDGATGATCDITLQNADCAEDFDLAPTAMAEPGTVMVFGPDGALRPSAVAYDKTVAGVVSGGCQCKPAIVLGRDRGDALRVPLALIGKVHCKVDASYSAIEAGDLLTTSSTLGHAMKATDPSRAFGAVIGKALRTLKEGTDLIPILVALQ
jgi:hypothetical protein